MPPVEAVLLLGCGDYGFSRTDPSTGSVRPPTGAAETASLETAGPRHETAASEPATETEPGETGAVVPPDTEPAPGIARDPVYACTTSDLFTIDPERGDATWIGAFHDGAGAAIVNVLDLAIDLEGVLYGGTFDTLFRIDADTAEATPLCAVTVDLYAMTVTAEGVLHVGGQAAIWRLDPSTCAAEPLLVDAPYDTAGDLVGLPDGYLYWTVWGQTFGQDELVRVDPASGALVFVGAMGVDRSFGVAYSGDRLYAFTDEGEIVAVDPATATTEPLAVGGNAWWGATTNPITW